MTTHEKLLARLIRRVNIRQDTPSLIMIIAADANHLWACRAIVNPMTGPDGISSAVLKQICTQYGWQPDDLKKKLLPAAKALGIMPAGHAYNYYRLLEVGEKATPHEIKKAFRNKAFSVHPDTASNPSTNAESFQELLDAYHTLRDPVLRGIYDANRQRRWREHPARLKSPTDPASVDQWYLGGLILIFTVLLLLTIIINEG